MTFFSAYLNELHYRCWYLILGIVLTFFSIYLQAYPILVYLAKPLKGTQLVLTDLSEFFISVLTLSTYLSFFFSYPLVLYHLLTFFGSSLYKKENIVFTQFIQTSSFIYFLSFLFISQYILPFIIQFLFIKPTISAAGFIDIQCLPKLHSYVNVSTKILFFFLTFYQLILFIFFLLKIKWIKSSFFSQYRKVIYILILLITALLSPPDILSQLILSVCFFIIYEFVILYSVWHQITS